MHTNFPSKSIAVNSVHFYSPSLIFQETNDSTTMSTNPNIIHLKHLHLTSAQQTKARDDSSNCTNLLLFGPWRTRTKQCTHKQCNRQAFTSCIHTIDHYELRNKKDLHLLSTHETFTAVTFSISENHTD